MYHPYQTISLKINKIYDFIIFLADFTLLIHFACVVYVYHLCFSHLRSTYSSIKDTIMHKFLIM